ncbi:MAG TPA: hypothetical protein VK797_02450 [Tepidisphaeraceae bacterium]|nr:hypothetical protein [Tepidisphaeraceae bacterium]
MKKRKRRKTVAERITAGMRELEKAMRSGKPLHEMFTVRTVEVPDPPVYDAKAIRGVRRRLGVSQAIFAKLVGVSVELVEHWEQGVCAPRPVARRLLDEIMHDPDDFLHRRIGPQARRLKRAG